MYQILATRVVAAPLTPQMPNIVEVGGVAPALRCKNESDALSAPENGRCTDCAPEPIPACEQPCCVGTGPVVENMHNTTASNISRVYLYI